jgi:hypothetical protein
VLQHGLAVYQGKSQEDWDGLPLDDFVAAVSEAIEKLTPQQ